MSFLRNPISSFTNRVGTAHDPTRWIMRVPMAVVRAQASVTLSRAQLRDDALARTIPELVAQRLDRPSIGSKCAIGGSIDSLHRGERAVTTEQV